MNFICERCGRVFSVQGEDAVLLMNSLEVVCLDCEQEQEESEE